MPVALLDPRAIRAHLHLSRERMGRILDVSAKTVERMEAGAERYGLPGEAVGVARAVPALMVMADQARLIL